MTEREQKPEPHIVATFAVLVAVPGIVATVLGYAALYLLGDCANVILMLYAAAADFLALILGAIVIGMAPWRGGQGIKRGIFALFPALLLLGGGYVLTSLRTTDADPSVAQRHRSPSRSV